MGMRFFITCDPANARHIFTTNYTNFPKGAEFAALFDIMIGSIFTIDGEPARRQRAKIKGVLSSPQFLDNTDSYCLHKTEKKLLPFFTEMACVGTPFDVQYIMSRFMFDTAATPLFGVDPGLLSSDMLPMDVAVALDTIMEVGFFRLMMPTFCWKSLRRLNIGPERKLSTAHGVLRFCCGDAGVVEEQQRPYW
ncbi:hypothetical protein ZWY2020_046387 [Hordeum vulgare]|nr:hypothetical protein ZWY2020_046387 [Hordeum vulgare]